MISVKQTVSQNLKKICKTKGIKNKQVAEYLGVSEGSVSHWFREDNSIDIDNLYNLCKYLGVSLNQVFGVEPLVSDILNQEEWKLIEAYRNAEPTAREYALETLEHHQIKTPIQESLMG